MGSNGSVETISAVGNDTVDVVILEPLFVLKVCVVTGVFVGDDE